jgi:hypothetical protein
MARNGLIVSECEIIELNGCWTAGSCVLKTEVSPESTNRFDVFARHAPAHNLPSLASASQNIRKLSY